MVDSRNLSTLINNQFNGTPKNFKKGSCMNFEKNSRSYWRLWKTISADCMSTVSQELLAKLQKQE